MRKGGSLPGGMDWLKGEEWPERYPYVNGFVDPCVQAFDSVPRSLYGGVAQYALRAPIIRRPRYGWEGALGVKERLRILNVVRSTSLSTMYSELEEWAHLH